MRRLPLVAVLAAASVGLSTIPAAHAATERAATLRTFAAYPQVGAQITMFGTVSSTPSGSPVTIQELRSGSWVDVATTTTADAGSYSRTVTPAFNGTRSFRAVAPSTGELAKATSPTLTLSVRRKPAVQFDQAPYPTVTGTHTVGSTLTVQFGTWSPDLKKYVQWIRDGTPLSAYSQQYKLTTSDLGKHMTAMVYSFRSDAKTIRESPPGEVVREGTFKTARPLITGEAAVGQPLTASAPGWTPQPTTLTYRWLRNGTPIAGATAAQYTVSPDDPGTELSVEARGERAGYLPATATSHPVIVPGAAPVSDVTFGDRMRPFSASVLPQGDGSFESTESPPSWEADQLTRWDTAGAFTHSLTPHPMGTLRSAQLGTDVRHPPSGAEYFSTNSMYKNADISFTFTGRRFAIEYRAHADSDAMVWIDGRPLSGSPILGRDAAAGRTGNRQFIVVTLPERRTVDVRFAGPHFFTGVHTPESDAATIAAAPVPFTLGILSDSFHENCHDASDCMSQSGAPMLSTVTGFRVWNLSEGGTGYLNPAGNRGPPGHQSSPYGSQRRLDAVANAPIDALLVHGSYNDKTTWTADQHRAALEKLLTDLRETRPDLPVVLAGIEGASYSRNVSHYGPLTANFAGMVGRHANVVGFIDGYTDRWFTGTGSTANPQGDGNQDQYIGADGYHPNGAGQAYYQGRLADELEKLPLPMN